MAARPAIDPVLPNCAGLGIAKQRGETLNIDSPHILEEKFYKRRRNFYNLSFNTLSSCFLAPNCLHSRGTENRVLYMGGSPSENDPPLAIILLGPPGSGKGTHAPALSHHLKIPHISTGDLFRDNIRNRTPIGQIAQGFIDQGRLVPDEVVLSMLASRLASPDCQKGAILDGVPRTIPQAEALDQKLGETHRFVALLLNVDSDLLIERICGRAACKQCNRPYHKKYDPPKQKDLCDACGIALYQRSDDTEEVLKKRLEIYQKQTEPLIEYYRAKSDVLYEINGNRSKVDIFHDLLKTLSLEPLIV